MIRNSWVAFKFKGSVIVLVLSLLVAVFYYIGNSINVYKFAFLGALFEMLSISMVLLLLGLPVISFVSLVKEKFNLRSLHLYSFIISMSTLLCLLTMK